MCGLSFDSITMFTTKASGNHLVEEPAKVLFFAIYKAGITSRASILSNILSISVTSHPFSNDYRRFIADIGPTRGRAGDISREAYITRRYVLDFYLSNRKHTNISPFAIRFTEIASILYRYI